MTVKDLKKMIAHFPDNLEVVIDHDENGWYGVERLAISECEDSGEKFANIVSSNEGK